MGVRETKKYTFSCLAISLLVCFSANSQDSAEYGQGQDANFSDYIAEEAKMTKKDKDYQREVKASWPRVTNFGYFFGMISYPSVNYNLNTSSIIQDKTKVASLVSVDQLTVPSNFQTGQRVFALSGGAGYKWEKLALEFTAAYFSSRPMYARVNYLNIADITDSSVVNPAYHYDVYGEISTLSIMLGSKYHIFNYKRISPYIGGSLGLRKNFGTVFLYDTKGTTNQDFSLLSVRTANAQYLNYSTTSSDDTLISGMFDSIQSFFNAISYTAVFGTQFYLVDNLILDVSLNYSNYRAINVMRNTIKVATDDGVVPKLSAIDSANSNSTTTAFLIDGPCAWGVSIGLQYQF